MKGRHRRAPEGATPPLGTARGGAALSPSEGALWRLSGSPSVSMIVSGKYKCPSIFVQFREYFLKYFSEMEKQQKTGTDTVASC